MSQKHIKSYGQNTGRSLAQNLHSVENDSIQRSASLALLVLCLRRAAQALQEVFPSRRVLAYQDSIEIAAS